MVDVIKQNGLFKWSSRSVHHIENPPEFKGNLNSSAFGLNESRNRERIC